MPVWWYKLGLGEQQIPLAIEAEDDVEADLEIQRYMEWYADRFNAAQGPWKPREFDGCRSCKHLEPCMVSAWEGGDRIGGPREKRDSKEYSTVHSCPTCGEKVIDLRMDYGDPKRNIVPDDCPRWNENFASAIDCGGCRGERDALHQSHPKYQERADAAMTMMTSVLEQAKKDRELPDGVDSLDSKRLRDESVKALTATMNPLGAMQGAVGDPKREKAVAAAAGLLTPLWEAVWETDEFKSEWYRAVDDGLDQAMQTMLALSWLDGLFLAIDRHPKNGRALSHEWHLVFTDHAVASRAMRNMPIEKRKGLLARWQEICEEHVA